MARTTPEEYAEKWGRNLKGSTEYIRKGIARVTVAPGVKAAQAKDLMQTKLNESINDGTWGARVSAVSKEDWQEAASTKGVQRISQGVDTAMPKQVGMAGKLLKAVDESAAIVHRMPKGTIEDSAARAGTFIREMNKRKLRRPGAV